MKKNIVKNSKGITLVSLTVTIIVILILTGITTNVLLGKNGVVTIMREAEANQTLAQEQGQAKLEELKGEEKYTKDGVKYIADEDAPTINEFKQTDKTQYSITVKVDVTENKSGIATIKYKIGEGEWQADVTNPVATTYTFTGLEEATIYEVSVEVTDEEDHKATATIKASTYSISLSEAKKDDMLSKKINTPILIDEDRITIPSGYKIAEDTADSIDYGIVIEDKNGNEWVWVPVEDVKDYYEASNTTEYKLCSTSNVTTSMFSKTTITIGKDSNTLTYSRTTPGTTSSPYFREPDLTSYSLEITEEIYKDILGFDSAEAMAQSFVDKYAKMIKSIDKYKGFFIGRYELSEEGIQKNKSTLVSTNWFSLYKKCEQLNGGNMTEAGMVWGLQWDATCDFIANKGEEKNIADSTEWGNYYYSISPANTGNYTQGEYKNTGSNDNWKANNIYDFAGNYEEWTQEAYYWCCRGIRGRTFYGRHLWSRTTQLWG